MQNVARHLDVVFWFKVYSSGLVFDNLKVQMNDMRQKVIGPSSESITSA